MLSFGHYLYFLFGSDPQQAHCRPVAKIWLVVSRPMKERKGCWTNIPNVRHYIRDWQLNHYTRSNNYFLFQNNLFCSDTKYFLLLEQLKIVPK